MPRQNRGIFHGWGNS
ncbi:prolyl endopeptidase domain protein, partial [Vibrio parahaemolyticus V-223/04]